MNATQTGLIAGLILGTAGAIGGLLGFLVALVIGALGFVIGRMLDGDLELGDLLNRGKDR